MSSIRTKLAASYDLNGKADQQRRAARAHAVAAAGSSSSTPAPAPVTKEVDKEFASIVQQGSGRGRKKQVEIITPKIKEVLELLKKERRDMTQTEVIAKLELNKLTEKQVASIFQNLQSNPKCKYNPLGSGNQGTYTYQSSISIANKDQLLALLKQPEYKLKGISIAELLDSYEGVAKDIEELKKEEKGIMVIKNTESKQDIIYYTDPSYKLVVDQAVRTLWRDVKGSLPNTLGELYDLMKRNSLVPLEAIESVAEKEKRKRENDNDRKEKKKRSRKLTKITNTHLKDQLNINGETTQMPTPKI